MARRSGGGADSDEPDDAGAPSEQRGEGERGAAPSGEEALRLAGAELLRGGSPKQVIRKLFEGDPLGIAERCGRALARRVVLLDMHELFTCALARVAFDAAEYVAGASLALWLDLRIENCIEEGLLRDLEDERDGRPVVPPFQTRYLLFAALIGIDPRRGRQACIVFNRAPEDERRAFLALKVQRKRLPRYVAEGFGPPKKARDNLRRILERLARIGGEGWQGPDLREWRRG